MHRHSDWTTANLGDLSGKRAIVTGANSGIGLHTAIELGRAGADVVVACRDPGRASEAVAEMKREAPHGAFRFERLDLASQASVRSFAASYVETGEPLDLLVNNAGVMALPSRELTEDGFERQMATNHLGHFALTGLLLPALRKSADPRVVVVSSSVALWGKVSLDNLQSERHYAPMAAYSQTKLANLLFALELARRAPWLTVTAAHPGGTVSNLQKHAFRRSVKLFGQPASQGALPSLRAAVERCPSGTYFGPKHLFNMRGAPVEVRVPGRARNADLGGALFRASQELTHVWYDDAVPLESTA